MGFLKQNLKHCSPATKEKAYQALVRPRVEYCSSVWDCHTAKNVAQVEMVQRRAAPWVLSRYNRQDRVSDMLNCLGWKTLSNCFTSSETISPMVIMGNSTYTLIWASFLSHPLLRRIFKSFLLFPRSIQEWNRLPRQVALAKSLKSFKDAIREIY